MELINTPSIRLVKDTAYEGAFAEFCMEDQLDEALLTAINKAKKAAYDKAAADGNIAYKIEHYSHDVMRRAGDTYIVSVIYTIIAYKGGNLLI